MNIFPTILSDDSEFESLLVTVQAQSLSFSNPALGTEDTFFGKKFYNKVTLDNTFSADIWLDNKWRAFDYFDNWFKRVYNVEGGYFNSFRTEIEYLQNCERDIAVRFMKPVSFPIVGVATRFNPYFSERLLDPVDINTPVEASPNAVVNTGLEGYAVSKRVIDPLAQVVPYFTIDSNYVVSKSFVLKNCKILKVDDVTGTYENGNGMTVKVTMCFDSIEQRTF